MRRDRYILLSLRLMGRISILGKGTQLRRSNAQIKSICFSGHPLAIHRSWPRAIAFGRPGRYSPRMAKKADPTKAYNVDDATGFMRLNELRLKVAVKL